MALSFSDIQRAAESLGVEACAVKAMVEVESSGSGFLLDGRVKVLFEGHIFWKELIKAGFNPVDYALKFPNIVYQRWDKGKYKGGSAEWERLNSAALINKKAALCSASYGLFQIMGFNHKACGFSTVQDFVDAQKESEARQLESFCAFMRSENLIQHLSRKDWSGFAKRYNGPGYTQNQYDVKLARAYDKCKQEALTR